jgi:hypothetical protein
MSTAGQCGTAGQCLGVLLAPVAYDGNVVGYQGWIESFAVTPFAARPVGEVARTESGRCYQSTSVGPRGSWPAQQSVQLVCAISRCCCFAGLEGLNLACALPATGFSLAVSVHSL